MEGAKLAESPENDDLLGEVTTEIEAVHDFISAWYRGEEPRTAEAFAAGLADRLAPDLVNIQPAGRVLERDALLTSIEAGHGTNPEFQIAIFDVTLRHVDEDRGLVLATYIETQTGARKSTPPTNARISSVLMHRLPGPAALQWLHIHETAVPDGA